MEQDWEQRTLNQELSLLKDGTHGTHKNVANGLYLLSAKNIKNGEIIITEQDRQISREEFNKIHRNFVLHSGDVLLTVVGSIGETAILTKPKDVTFQRSVAYLRPSQMKSQFLYNLIQTVGFQNELKKKQVVSAQPGVYLGDLKKISIKMTKNATEQIKISQFTQLIDKIITLHQRKINTLETQKKSYLNLLFPKINEFTPRLRFNNFKDEWEQRKLYEVAVVLDGDRGKNYPSSEEFSENGHTLFLSAANVTKNGFSFTNNQYITEDKSNSLGNGKLTTNDIVITSRGSIGHIAWYNSEISQEIPHARINSGMLILSIKEIYVANYIAQYLKSPMGIKTIHFLSFGSAQPQLTKKDIQNYKIPITLQLEQKKISSLLNDIDKLITLHQHKLSVIKKMKQVYLNKIFI